MKATKLISLLLVVAMLMSVLVVGVNAVTISIGEVDYKAQTGYQTNGASRLPLDSDKAVTMTAYAAGTQSEYVTISTEDELMKFAELVNNGDTFEGRKVYLIGDMDMDGKTWTPIGNNTSAALSNHNPGTPYFRGYFDGQGHTIRNLDVNVTTGTGSEIVYASLFGYVRGAVICNLIIDSTCSFTYAGESTNARTGVVGFVMSLALAGDPIGTYSTDKVTVLIENVQNKAAVKGGTGYAGGIVALGSAHTSYAPIIQCCESLGGVSGRVAAGIIGFLSKTVTTGSGRNLRIWGCKVAGTIQGSEMQAPMYNKDSNCTVDPYAGNNKNDSTGVKVPFLIEEKTWVSGYQADFAGYRPIQVTDDLVSMTNYKAGTTSKSNTYTISTADELLAFTNLVNDTTKNETFVGKYVYLTADIDMSGKAWTPIGNNVSVWSTNINAGDVTCFRGYFDGQHHSIKNLTVTSEATGNANVGLFGFVRGAVICNLVIDSSCSFTYNGTSTTARTGVIAFVASMGADGGLFGDYLGKSSDAGQVSVLIENVKSHAVVNGGTGFAGGIVAMAAGFTSYQPIIQTCESAGAVSGRVAGGILGAMNGNNSTRWIRLFANKTTGTVCGTEYAGAIYNKIPNMGGVEANGFNHAIEANMITTGYDLYLTGYSKDNVSAVDLTNVPHINDYNSEPALKLTEAADLQTLADKVAAGNTFANVTIYVANDLDCSALTDFKGIGSYGDSLVYFQGIFDGQGHIISNLTVSGNGLFNAVSSNGANVVIRNVYLDDYCAVNASGNTHVGGLVGYAFIAGGTSGISIYNCYVGATLNGAESRYTAGFVGLGFNGSTDAMALKVRNCTFAGVANAIGGCQVGTGWDDNRMFAGIFDGDNHVIYNLNLEDKADGATLCLQGFFGYVGYGEVYNLGIMNGDIELNGSTRSATLIGASRYELVVSNCFNRANITFHNGTDMRVGGLIGAVMNTGSSYRTIENCYNAGDVTVNMMDNGSIHTVGGIVGYISDGARNNFKNCYNTGDITVNSNHGTIAPANLNMVGIGSLVGSIPFVGTFSFENCGAGGSVNFQNKNESGNACVGAMIGFVRSGTVLAINEGNTHSTEIENIIGVYDLSQPDNVAKVDAVSVPMAENCFFIENIHATPDNDPPQGGDQTPGGDTQDPTPSVTDPVVTTPTTTPATTPADGGEEAGCASTVGGAGILALLALLSPAALVLTKKKND